MQIENRDYALCALAETVNGACSVDLSYRVLAYYSAWITTPEGQMITQGSIIEAGDMVNAMSGSSLPSVRMSLSCAASAVWTWFKHMNLSCGPDIQPALLLRMITAVGTDDVKGGSVLYINNLIPLKVDEVRRIRGTCSISDFIREADSIINHIPYGHRTQPRIATGAEVDGGGWF